MRTCENKLEGVGAIFLFTEGGLPYQCVCCHLLHLQSTVTSSNLFFLGGGLTKS